jgi:hypothetical protein
MVATASASDSHDDIYCSVALPLKLGMAWDTLLGTIFFLFHFSDIHNYLQHLLD